MLDVRSPAEWDDGHLPGSLHRYLPDLVAGASDEIKPDAEVRVVCASGYRASIAAGLLERAGVRPIVLPHGGVPDMLTELGVDSI